MPDTIHHDAPDEGAFHLEWIEIARILLVFLAAAAVWIQLWEPFSAFSMIGMYNLDPGPCDTRPRVIGICKKATRQSRLLCFLSVCPRLLHNQPFFTYLHALPAARALQFLVVSPKQR